MKKLNLIKRLLSYSHEKQKVRGMQKYCILLLLLFTCVTQAYATNYNTFAAGDVIFYDFSDVTGNGGTNWHTGKNMMYDASGAGTVKCVIFTSSITMTTDWVIAKTAKGSWAEIKFQNRTNSAHNCIKVNADGDGYTWTTHTKTVAEYVASGDYIMVYGGEPASWKESDRCVYRFMSADNIDNTKGGGHSCLTKSINGENYDFGAALLTSGTYYQGHWASGLSCAIAAGSAYVVRGTASLSSDYYSDAKATSGDNSLYQVKKQSSAPTTSLTPTCPSSITAGSKLPFTPGDAGVSVLGLPNTIKYYLKNGSTYTEKTLSDGKIDVSELGGGNYSIITLLYDGYIYVKASEDEFDVYDTWAMYSGSTKIRDFTTTDGIHYSLTDFVINNDNNTNTHYLCSSNANYAEAGANSLCVAKGSAPSLSFSNGQIAWQDGNGTYNIYIYNSSGTWKIYAEKTASEETWYWIAGNGAETGSETVTKQLMDATGVSGVYSTTRTLTQNQTFHFGNTIKGYWPKTPAQSNHTDVTSTSSDIQLAGGGSTYWFQFTPADQPVVMKLNTNTDPYTISFSNPVYTITYYDQGGVAFSGTQTSAPTTHTYGTATNLKIPTKTGYDFAGWYTVSDCSSGAVGTSSAASLSATGYTANINLYAKWTLKVSDITYSPSTPIGFDYTTAPSSAAYTSTVNLTISRWPGYTISVSAEDVDGGSVTVSNATSRTPSFTMPAKGVIITVTATKINKPIVYVMKTQVAAGSNIENFSAVANTCLFWGWQKGGTTNFYSSDAVYGTNVALSDARAGSYTDEHGNTWYEFVSNQSSFDLETEYGVILRLSASDTRLYESNADDHYVDKTSYDGADNHSFYKGITWLVPNGTSLHSAQLYTSNPDGVNRASIKSLDLSATRIPPLATITATPNMYNKGAVNKAYCWKLYSNAGCTSEVTTSFTSLGDGKVTFTAPKTTGTYYLKLTIHASDACNAAVDDEAVQSFTVTTDDMVFFKNVPGWGNVHVYFLGTSDYWDENKGSGCAGRDNGIAHGMTRIGNSDVYYYDYYGNSNVVFDGDGKAYIAFTDNYKPNSNNFSECQAVYRGDFSECAAMYVPENWITHYLNNAAYYNRGYWTRYMDSGSAYTLHVYDMKDGGTEVFSHEFTGTAGVNTYSYTHDFKDVSQSMPYVYYVTLVGCNGSTYGSADDMDISKCSNWNFYTDTRRCGLKVQAKLKHTFILTLTGDGHIQLSVEYPISVGDYRLLYNDNTQDHPHPSQYIRKRDDGKDTVAMFIRPSAATKTMKVQSCTGIVGETITWEDYNWKNGSPNIDISGISEDGVYVFYLEQDGSGDFNNVSNIEPYSGKYYIRTNCLDGGWNSYKSSDDNLMTYAQYPEDRGYGFNYYKAKWVGSTGTDVTYTIACDYSPSLCDTLTADPDNNPLSASEAASLPHTANIRFGWHSKTNQLKREYINGSTNVSDRFLVMIGDTKLKDKNGNALAISGLNANEISFTDINNWIYRCDIQAQTGAAVKLQATYDGHEQYFIGGEDKTEEIIGGSSGEWYGMRVTYDFKTNRLMTAWLPSGNAVESDVELNADMMLIRKGQNAATQVYFGASNKDKSISNIHRIYGVLEFQYDSIAGKFSSWSSPNAYKYLMYYLSFPFDVKVSEIFGCGVRGKNWIIQKYNGAKRAQIGWFAETSTFWETLPGDSTLHANEGYLLILDRISFNDASSSLWYKQGSGNSIYLYFPSTSDASGTIKDNNEEVTIKIPSHTCNIQRPFTPDIDDWSGGELVHSNTDSHWNVFGIPLFQSKAATTVGDSELKYFYSWNYTDNTLRPKVTLAGDTAFKSMHGYMVQFAGDVTFTGAHISASVAARRMPSNKHYLAELQLVNENGDENATYVELRENANTDFQLNEDMYMMRSSNTVDLYSFAGAYDVAANVLPIDDQLVRVGMDVKQAGTYRFTMPSEFSGTVTLIDNLMGTRTNMALGDHEVYLERGVDNNRFLLEIDIQQMPTAIDGVGGSLKDGKAHKFIENGQMYILKDGIIYDARGSRVK